MKQVLLVGEPLGLFIAEDYGDLSEINRFTKGIAGAEVNVGIGLARLGIHVNYMTKLGDDPFGLYIVKRLQQENIRTDYVLFDSVYRTGLQIKNKVKDGDPKVAYYRKGSAFTTLTKTDVDRIDFSNVDVFHITGIPPATSQSAREAIFYLAEKAKANNCFITFDPNLRPSLWEDNETMIRVLNELACYANVVLPGISEGKILSGKDSPEEIAAHYFDLGVEVVVIKNGSKGAFIQERNTSMKEVAGYKVEKVVDTVGAGDGFAVGVISGYLDGLTLEEAVNRANAIGSLQVQNVGDNEGLPTREKLDEYMKKSLHVGVSKNKFN